ncbi:carboxypeptidase B [Manduca sexta]|uniref:Peptidase M14 domain-containing protein n=1 Tax=Manduca sexta TaxID=7130 RepID=A0A922CJM8_MANSE|nr:carboxypeptidase B [Manduca sexta]KAG6448461.1 hypothetical protein O3G_MSEX005526 [Manduca sexta]
MFLLLWFLVALSVALGRNEEYIGYRVYNVQLSNQHQVENFRELKSDLVDYWRRPSLEYGIVGLAMVPPSHFNWFEEQLLKLDIPKNVAIEDVYEYLKEKEQSAAISRTEDGDRIFDYRAFYRYNEILNYLRALEETYTNSTINLQLVEYGRTDQDRPLVYLRINNDTEVQKPIVVLEAAINPRDWITVPSALYAVDRLLKGQELLNGFDWIVIPVVNPDGYEYTHTNLRLWSKSRSTRSHLGSICPGVNINRNFDMDWLRFDSSSSPCSHLYGGIHPFSEIESRLTRSLLEEYGTRIRLYVSLQNNGGYVTYPWLYERAASGMFRQHHLLGLDMVNAMNSTYLLGVGSLVLGDRASGTSVDYMRNHNILYTYNIDVVQRDGVIIPEEDILEIVDHVWRGIETAANGVIVR